MFLSIPTHNQTIGSVSKQEMTLLYGACEVLGNIKSMLSFRLTLSSDTSCLKTDSTPKNVAMNRPCSRPCLPPLVTNRKTRLIPKSRSHIFSWGSSVFAFSCSPIMHNAPVSALRISARRYASRRPMCTTSQITLASVPSGTGRRYVTLRFRLTPPEVKMPGFDMAIKTVDVSTSMIVAAQPPWRLPMRLQRF